MQPQWHMQAPATTQVRQQLSATQSMQMSQQASIACHSPQAPTVLERRPLVVKPFKAEPEPAIAPSLQSVATASVPPKMPPLQKDPLGQSVQVLPLVYLPGGHSQVPSTELRLTPATH